MQLAPEGAPDIIGIMSLGPRKGAMIAIEVKLPGENPTEQQEAFMAKLAASGAIVGVATSVKEALEIIRRA